MGDVQAELDGALDALLAADRLLRERDNVEGPDAVDAASYYPDEYLADWRAIREAITASAAALGRDVDLLEPAPAPRM